MNRPVFHAPSGFCDPAGWSVTVCCIVGFGLGGWDAAEAVHQALLVEPSEVVGGDDLDVALVAQRARWDGESGRTHSFL